MPANKIKIGVLTSSRADYGIYKPLLSKLIKDARFELEIIVFGMHLLKKFGNTINNIKGDNWPKIHKVQGMGLSDDPLDIARSYGELILHFNDFWDTHKFDLVFALGDRFEMSAAVQAGIPHEVKFAHFHGGETTLGAVDNIYRHQIALASCMHFVATSAYKKKLHKLMDDTKHIYNVGALSLDNISNVNIPEWNSVRAQFNIQKGPFILVTFHPETIGLKNNKYFSTEIYDALEKIGSQMHIVITLPNADALGSLFREQFENLKKKHPNKISLIDNFGRENYFAAIKASSYLLGNTSSGIIEAASFNKYVINVGDRQAGRLQSKNIINVPFNSQDIISATEFVFKKKKFEGENIYAKPNTVINVVKKLANAKL